MFHLTRRALVAAGAAVASASQSQRPSDMQDAKAPPQRRLLESRYTAVQIAKLLVPREKWSPYPVASDRTAWQGLPGDVRASIMEAGERALKSEWSVLPATLFLEYVRNGNRSNYERVQRSRRERLQQLVLAECVEGKDRFLDEIANGLWLTCEETFWGYPAHMSLQKDGAGLPDVTEPVIDLFAAEAGSLIAWTDYLLAPQLEKAHRQIVRRIRHEIDRRILTPFERRSDFWWMGLEANRPMNNWNPWINSNCLACALLVERDAARRARLAHKVLLSLDRFLDSYHDDGGCDEGPGYWGHAGGSLFDNLELLYLASNRQIDLFREPVVREIGRYIYRVHIADDWFVNFADASARVSLDGGLVYRYGARIADEDMQVLGAWAEQSRSMHSPGSLLRALPALFNLTSVRKAPARQPLVRDAWLPGIEVMTARLKTGSRDGLYLAAQGGHNAESHNHNDVGNFVVFANGRPVIIDVGVETYTAKTFSSRRYEIWTMQSAYHNLPTVNGIMQAAGRSFAARNVSCQTSEAEAVFSLDIAGAYPPEAGIESWRRTLRLNRSRNEILVRDAWVLQKAGGRIEFTLMTPCDVIADEVRGQLALADQAKVHFTPGQFECAVETVKTEDPRLRGVWGQSIRRILLKARNVAGKGESTLRIAQA